MSNDEPLSPTAVIMLRAIQAIATKDAKRLREAVEAGYAVGLVPKPGWDVVLLEWEASGADGPIDPEGRTAMLTDLPWVVG